MDRADGESPTKFVGFEFGSGMAGGPRKPLRTAFTAMLVLGAALVAAEVWLRSGARPASIVCSQADRSIQSLLVPSETSHHGLRPGVELNLAMPSGAIRVTTNSFGCRGDEPESEPGAGTYRILMLGDDLLFGASVSQDRTVPERVQQFLSKKTSRTLEVINGGVPGYCPLLSLLQYQHHLKSLKPNLVILHVDMSDPDDDRVYRSLLKKDRDRDELTCAHPLLRVPQKPLPKIVDLLKGSAFFSRAMSCLRLDLPGLVALPCHSSGQHRYNWIADYPEDLRLQVDHSLVPIRQLRDAVEASGAHLLVTTCPVLWQVTDGASAPQLTHACDIRGKAPFRSRFPFEILQAFCAREGIRFLDTSPEFMTREESEKLFSTDCPTLSSLGMALYARSISSFLLENPPSRWETTQRAPER